MKKILCTLMSIMMILAVATGCGQTGGDASSAQTGETGTKVITNCDGTEVTVPEKVDKIGCLFGPMKKWFCWGQRIKSYLTETIISTVGLGRMSYISISMMFRGLRMRTALRISRI